MTAARRVLSPHIVILCVLVLMSASHGEDALKRAALITYTCQAEDEDRQQSDRLQVFKVLLSDH